MSNKKYSLDQTHLYRSYNPVVRYVFHQKNKTILGFVSPSHKVLEVGCGGGYLTQKLIPSTSHLDVIDINSNNIKHIQSQHPSLKNHFKVSDLLNYSPARKYDVIICSEVLEHIKDDKKAMRKMGSLLDQKGKIVLTVPNEKLLLVMRKILFPRRYKELEKNTRHVHHYTHKDIKKLCDFANLRITYFRKLPKIRIFFTHFFFIIEKK